LFLPGRRVLLSGDAMVTQNPLTGGPGPQIMPSGVKRDTAQALHSLDALKGCFSHGTVAGAALA
jgi:hypothetical protein